MTTTVRLVAAAIMLGALPGCAPIASAAGTHVQATCRNGYFPSYAAALSIATVRGPGRLDFLNDDGACPNASPGCHSNSYVIAGDQLLTGATHGDYVCAYYADKPDENVAGWVLRARLAWRPPAPPPQASDWAGKWMSGDDTIRITALRHGLRASGEAWWPNPLPPADQMPYGPNVGDFAGVATPQHDHVTFNDGNCSVTATIVARHWLVVHDNHQCGGMNVNFDGVYTRRAPASRPQHGN